MDQDIEKYVASCLLCQLHKAKVSKHQATMATRIHSHIFECFSADLLDMTSISSKYRYILVIMDYFSGFVLLTPLRSKLASSVGKAFWDCFALFGPPESLLTDNGTEFVNNLVEKLTSDAKIQHVLTYAYHAEGNAKNERSHQQTRQMLRILADKHPHRWWHFIPYVQYALNTRVNAKTLCSPYEVLFGRRPRSLHNTAPFLEIDHEDMRTIRQHLKEIIQEHHKTKQQLATQAPPPLLQVGDQVILIRKFPLHSKAFPLGKGPYTVTKLIGNTGVFIQSANSDGNENPIRVARVHLQKFFPRIGDGEKVPEKNGEKSESRNDKDGENIKTVKNDERVGIRLKEQSSGAREKDKPCRINEEHEDVSTGMEIEDDASLNLVENQNGKNSAQEDEEDGAGEVPKELRTHNPQVSIIKQVPEIGHMCTVKQDEGIRCAEIVEDKDDLLSIHWYGTESMKTLPRKRWKYYPGWETSDGKVVYENTQDVMKKPARCDISKRDVMLVFKKLSSRHTLPFEILEKTEDLQLI